VLQIHDGFRQCIVLMVGGLELPFQLVVLLLGRNQILGVLLDFLLDSCHLDGTAVELSKCLFQHTACLVMLFFHPNQFLSQ